MSEEKIAKVSKSLGIPIVRVRSIIGSSELDGVGIAILSDDEKTLHNTAIEVAKKNYYDNILSTVEGVLENALCEWISLTLTLVEVKEAFFQCPNDSKPEEEVIKKMYVLIDIDT